MGFYWTQEEYQRALSPAQLMLRDLLEDWFWAMQDGRAELRLPDPGYPAVFSSEEPDRLVQHLDVAFEDELCKWVHQPNAGAYEAGPGFGRLRRPQRIALCQQVHAILSGRWQFEIPNQVRSRGQAVLDQFAPQPCSDDVI